MHTATQVVVYEDGGRYDLPVTSRSAKIGSMITAPDGKTYVVMELSDESVRDLNREPNMLVLLQDGRGVHCMRPMLLLYRWCALDPNQQQGIRVFVPQQSS